MDIVEYIGRLVRTEIAKAQYDDPAEAESDFVFTVEYDTSKYHSTDTVDEAGEITLSGSMPLRYDAFTVEYVVDSGPGCWEISVSPNPSVKYYFSPSEDKRYVRYHGLLVPLPKHGDTWTLMIEVNGDLLDIIATASDEPLFHNEDDGWSITGTGDFVDCLCVPIDSRTAAELRKIKPEDTVVRYGPGDFC